MKLYHPKWSKFVILPAIILMLCVGFAPILVLFFEDRPNYQSLYFFFPIAMFFTYFCLRGYALFKYRDVIVAINSNNQISIEDKNGTVILEKTDVLYKNHKMLTFVELFNKDNKKVAAFDHIYPDVEEFIRWAEYHLKTV